ncbi:MAG: TlpA disulfide reductase family protein [Actinobacteria bacterium]|nr:TlpA disulfide reductase family protein [Actinomycetota bacterium]
MSLAKSTRSVREPVSAIAVALACALLLSGCASDPLADQYRAGSGKNYIAGDGSVTEIVPENRSDAVVFEGVDESGATISSRELSGEVIVVNFWYAGCAPCRAEAPVLEEAFEDSASTGVAFVGVNVRDQAETAQTFNKEFGVTYSSIIDTNGQAQLAFATNVPPNAVPTTLVLDRQGRVAARILGQLKNASILTTIISDVAAEKN